VDRDACDLDVLRFNEADELAGAHFVFVLQSHDAVVPVEPLSAEAVVHKRIAVAVDCAEAGDGDIFRCKRDDEMLADPTFGHRHAAILFKCIDVVIVIHIVRCKERRAHFKMKLHIFLQPDGAGFPCAGRNDNSAAARCGAGIDGSLNRGGVERYAIGDGTVIFDVIHGVSPYSASLRSSIKFSRSFCIAVSNDAYVVTKLFFLRSPILKNVSWPVI